MLFLTPGFILIAGICLGAFLVAAPVTKRVKAAREALTADDLKTFGERYPSRNKRHDMPTKFNEFAQASDRAGRIWVIAVIALIAALIAYVFLGPNLGLPIGATP